MRDRERERDSGRPMQDTRASAFIAPGLQAGDDERVHMHQFQLRTFKNILDSGSLFVVFTEDSSRSSTPTPTEIYVHFCLEAVLAGKPDAVRLTRAKPAYSSMDRFGIIIDHPSRWTSSAEK
ncbi:hypothetical protein V7S43_005022 [Phytophthora oleae]|uniref:Uncharacterized protein n=1 Tax=Phytophthora oleae TaxID=2107226 RepID=A0ABD3FSC0_9STRA